MSGTDTAEPLASATLTWRDGQPQSAVFDDIYYSQDNGMAESRHVFIDGNELPRRWSALADNSDFVIIETGFGSGLNFLTSAALWLQRAPKSARLHFVSLEKYPLRRDDLSQALANWPELSELAAELITSYPPLVSGFHRRWLYADRVTLTLIFDDAVSGLRGLAASDHPAFSTRGQLRADAWFLDGFAPTKNPDLWSPTLFRQIARLSGSGTTASTFTVARQVRDQLSSAGFSLAKTPGFGRKRDMLRAVFSADRAVTAAVDPSAATVALPAASAQSSPLFRHHKNYAPLWSVPPSAHAGERRALVIGGGIAGCTSAAALRRRGWQVTLIERRARLASEASGNPQAVLYPRLSVEDQPLSQIGRQALCHAMAYYTPLWQRNGSGIRSGVLVLPESAQQQAQFVRIADRYREAPELVRLVSGAELSEVAGIPLAAERGLWFANLGWVSPSNICHALAQGCEQLQAEVAELHRDDRTGLWCAVDNNQHPIAEAPVVIIANAYAASRLTQTGHLPLRQIRGQISSVAATAASKHLQSVICGTGYLAPALAGRHTLGATYAIDDSDTALRNSDHQYNLATLAATDPLLAGLINGVEGGRAALRCTTPDYLPIAGPAPQLDAFINSYQALRRNAKADIPQPGPCHSGLWLNVGHGSRGFTYSPLTAELIASQLCGEPPPLPHLLTTALHPARFIIRDLKRKRR